MSLPARHWYGKQSSVPVRFIVDVPVIYIRASLRVTLQNEYSYLQSDVTNL